MTTRWLWVPLLLAMACGDDDGSDTSDDARTDGSMPADGGPIDVGTASCFAFVDGLLVFEAESIPLNEDWVVRNGEAGFNGDGYIEWIGESHNNDPTHGVIDLTLRVDEPGRYQLTWRTRIGMGDNTTEHNDTWVTFPDSADYYGLKGMEGAEVRRYPKPICEDGDAMGALMAMDDIETADCVRGSSEGGWLKVYSSGADDWRWIARTSDSDASTVTVEFDEAGDYTMRLAARADHSLLDRIVLYREGTDSDTREDLALAETRCD